MSTHQVALYLKIPAEYCRSFGGLRWAQYGEAIEFLDGPSGGRTFAFAQEIAVFLEGLYCRPAIQCSALGSRSICFISSVCAIAHRGRRAVNGAPSRESPARSVSWGVRLRNAGALCAWLCRRVPAAADPPELAEVHAILTGGNWVPRMVLEHPLMGALDQAEEPGLSAADFEALVRREAESLSRAEVRHWLRHGRAPGRPVEEPSLPHLPQRLALALAELEHRPRLAGIGRLASRMEAAICLPPRRLAWQELQAGGYADLATRGTPEQILPFQFALEGDEFIRRFAEHELLYFRREEPHQPTSEELVILVDQGVRTWGDVRLLLAAAALALAQAGRAPGDRGQAGRHQQRRRWRSISPRSDKSSLSALLESSDLSPHPGKALARLLQSPSTAGRDVVLLTHPRNLGEREVDGRRGLGCGRRLRAASSPFRSTLAGSSSWPSCGADCPSSWRGAGSTQASRNRSRRPRRRRPATRDPRGWKGTLESIGFPFSTGALDELAGRLVPGCVELRFR